MTSSRSGRAAGRCEYVGQASVTRRRSLMGSDFRCSQRTGTRLIERTTRRDESARTVVGVEKTSFDLSSYRVVTYFWRWNNRKRASGRISLLT